MKLNKTLSFILTFFFISTHLHAQKGIVDKHKKTLPVKIPYPNTLLKESILPSDHPIHEDLKRLFKNPSMFNSAAKLKEAGFKVHPRVHQHLMVAKHPSFKNYIFKKYQNIISKNFQLDKYLTRINNANIIQDFITQHHFQHLIVPKKWLYQLPQNFAPEGKKDYILIVEDMNICSGDDDLNGENVHQYQNMSKEILKEYCITIHSLNGCDAWPRNQPFTKSGQIAFVDTEHLGQKKGHFLTHILPVLNEDVRHYAQELWDQLEYDQQIKTSKPKKK